MQDINLVQSLVLNNSHNLWPFLGPRLGAMNSQTFTAKVVLAPRPCPGLALSLGLVSGFCGRLRSWESGHLAALALAALASP